MRDGIAFLNTLSRTANHLNKTDNSLTQPDDHRLRTLITNLRNDVGSTSEMPEETSRHG